MNIQVYPHRIILNKTNEVNSGEYNVNECTFEFSQEYEGLTKVAVFSLCDGTTKNVTILNNQCIIPVECLQETGQVQIGVYGYATQDNELVLRYSPTPQNFVVRLGSYKEGTQPVAPTPTDWEILVEQVSDIAEDVSSIHEDITGINGEISGINIDIRDLQDTKANISDLAEVAFTGEFSDLKNIPSYATTQQLNQEIQDRQDADVNLQSQIDAISVSSDVVDVVGTYQELLDYDTTHLKDNDIVKVLVDSTHNDALSYYRWDKEPQTWSYIGSEGPFYTKSETDALLNDKQDVIDIDNMLSSDLVDDNNSTNKFVTQADITNWNNKEDKSNKVTEINSSSTDTQYPSAKCVYDSQEVQNEHIAELEMLYNAFPTVSAEDTTIQLDNTAKVKFREIDLKGNTSQVVIPEEQGTSVSNTSIYVSDVNTDKEHTIEMSGNTYQETTTGANVMPVVNVTKTVNGITLTNNENGTITLNGTATAQVLYPITNTGNSTLRRVPVTENDYKFMLYGDTNVSNDTYFLQVLFGTETETTKFFEATDNGATSLHIETDRSIGYAIVIRNGQSFNNHIIKPMGVLSTYTGGFEPYTYGASPNPDYPQNIEVVTGTNNIEVCGKNAFDHSQFVQNEAVNGITASIENGYLKLSGIPNNANDSISKEVYITNIIKNLETSTFNTTLVEGTYPYTFRIYERDENNAIVNRFNGLSKTLTYTENHTYSIRAFVLSNTTLTNIKCKLALQIEKGSTATTYEAYQGTTYPVNLGNIELCKIDTYKDRIYKSNDKWYLEKNIGKADLSSLTWVQETTANSKRYATTGIQNDVVAPASNSNIINMLCNIYIKNSATWSWNTTSGKGIAIQKNKQLIIFDEDYTSASDLTNFTTMLSNKNACLYYPLATPTTTEITDTALVNQLNALYNATIYPITNINTDTSNLLPYIDLHYNFVTPSPSPSRPSVVNVVKGNNTITISNSDNTESQNYPINLGDMELCKIETYQDYIYESNGNWFKKSNIGKVVLNGSETWSKSANRFVCGKVASVIKPTSSNDEIAKIFSNKFVGITINNTTQSQPLNGIAIAGSGNLVIYYDAVINFTYGEFRNWVSTNNVLVYYILETPTDTQITDTTLITQLNNIKKAYSYDTQTNISQTNTDKPFIIYAESIRSLKDVFE